jgi:rod shape-determining protein MreD
MKPGVGLRRGALVVIAAFILDMSLGARMAVAGIRPDLTLAALVPVSLLIGQGSAAWLGLLAGSLQGAFASVAFGSLAVSRTVAAWLVGLIEARLFRDNLVVAGAAGFGAVLAADLLYFVFTPQPYPSQYALQTLGRAAYTMVLVVPATIGLRPLFRPRA